MKQMKFYIIFLIAFGLLPSIAFSQTYIGANIGADMSIIQEKTNSIGFQVLDENINNISFLVGLKVEEQLSEDFILSFSEVFNQKSLNLTDNGINPLNKVKFNTFETTLLLNWLPMEKLSFGLGASYLFTPDRTAEHLYFGETSLWEKSREVRGVVSTAYLYNNFSLNFSYYHNLSSAEKVIGAINPRHSLQLSLGYRLEVKDKKG